MAIELDKDIASTMTDEELEAINADASPDELLVMRQQAEADQADDDEDDEADDAPAVVAAAVETPTTQPDDESPQEDAPQLEFKPSYQASLPDDFADQVKAVDDEFKGLVREFKEGNLEVEDYESRMADIYQRRDTLTQAKITADVFLQLNAQNEQQSRAWTADQFAAKVKSEIDYQSDPEKVADFAAFAQKIESSPANANKPFEWVLQEAHKRVKVLYDIPVAAPTQKTLQEVKASRKPPVSVPQTLANVPGADGPGDVSGEFVDLDGMDGMDYETAIAKMTPAQRERYLKAA